MSDEITEVNNESWFGRMKNAIVGGHFNADTAASPRLSDPQFGINPAEPCAAMTPVVRSTAFTLICS